MQIINERFEITDEDLSKLSPTAQAALAHQSQAPASWLSDELNGIVTRLIGNKKRADVEVLFTKKTAEDIATLADAVKAAEVLAEGTVEVVGEVKP